MLKLGTTTKNITAIVATHEREKALDNMVSSFRDFFPDLKIIVVDSSSTPHKRDDVNHVFVDPESGISTQRNTALDLVTTELFLLLDDDFVCTEKTCLSLLIEGVSGGIYDVLGGAVNNIGREEYEFHGDYQILENVLYHFIDPVKESFKYDTIFNFFVAKTSLIKNAGGRDSQLKYAKEHDDFFLNLKRNETIVGYNKSVAVDHYSYKTYHGGAKSEHCVKHWLSKRNIKNKVEIRLIDKNDIKYISFHCFMEKINIIPEVILEEIKKNYGNYPIKITHA
ncbi:MAG TPA: glycosyltransferase [Candidatus Absconditabacterales bacterium]|nr:glycosyltransferase [Candidatus Absconditabacterales bacterium]